MGRRTPPLRARRPTFAGAMLAAVALCGGCSLLLHSDADQCTSSSDCKARGALFATAECMEGTCVAQAAITTDGSVVDARGDGPAEAEAEAEAAPPVDAGAEAEAGCRVAKDCPMTDNMHPEVACDVDIAGGTCVQLTTNECPLVAGDFSGTVAPPIFVGAFATLPPTGLTSHPSYQNYAMAISEFGQNGVPAYNPLKGGAGYRMPVAVVCNVAAPDITVPLGHLVQDVEAPAIVAALDSRTLKTTLANYSYPQKVFFVNPFGANSSLTDLTDYTSENRLWHMLGQPSDDAPAYQAIFPRVEAYVRSLNFPDAGAGTPLRVATVTAPAIDLTDLAGTALPLLTWNGGQNSTQNSPSNYLGIMLPDSVLNGTPLANISVANAVNALLAFQPHIIISFASSEFVTLLQNYELSIGSGTSHPSNPKPFYLVSPYNADSQALLSWIGPGAAGTSEARRSRVVGINVAATTDTEVLNVYDQNFVTFTGSAAGLGQENYYDAMYFAVYAMVAGGPTANLDGVAVGSGMRRLIVPTSPAYDMGVPAMGGIYGVLSNGLSTISLIGALGPPNFTVLTGARVGEADAYCVTRGTDGVTPVYSYDVMRLSHPADGGTPTFSGTFPCYGGL